MSTTSPASRGKVLLLENIHASAEALFREAGFEVQAVKGALKGEALKAALEGVTLLGIRSKTHVTADVLQAAPGLLSVGCFCIGTNQVELKAASALGMPVFNAPFSNTRSVAELVIAEVVVLSRQLGDRLREMHEGKWRKVSTGSHEVRGKTLGIVGYGHIGSQVGVLAESMGMRVLYHDVATKLPLGNARSCNTLEALLAESDVVTLHVPATLQTENLVAAPQLKQMKKGAALINNARGTVVDIAALADALRSGHLSGAAVDVYPEEPETNSDGFRTPLQGLPNVVMTPHVGGSTEEAQESIGREVATALLRFVRAGATTGSVNFPQVELPPSPGTHRVLNVHRNVPGVLGNINRIVSELDANIHAQMLSTDAQVGYLVMDIEKDVAEEVSARVAALSTDIRTRVA